MTPADDVLVQDYLNGNNDSLGILIARYESLLKNTIYLIVKDYDLTNDLFQETCINIMNYIGSYQDKSKFGAWAAVIARNLCLDHFRDIKAKKHFNIVRDYPLDKIAVEPEVKFVTRQNVYAAGIILDQLPAAQKEILLLRYYAELPFKEIASLLNKSINTVLGTNRYALINARKIYLGTYKK